MKNKNNLSEKNYLDFVPKVKTGLNWNTDENGNVTLELENKGPANYLAQLILKKPKKSYIHLDEMGNFVWPLINGKTNICEIGAVIKERFGEKAEPLYERLVRYFRMLEKYGFVDLNKSDK